MTALNKGVHRESSTGKEPNSLLLHPNQVSIGYLTNGNPTNGQLLSGIWNARTGGAQTFRQLNVESGNSHSGETQPNNASSENSRSTPSS